MKTRVQRPGGKQTVSLTIDSAVYATAKELGVNASRVAEEALAAEVKRRQAEALRKDIAHDLEAISAYEEKHGSFAEMVREHYESNSDD